MYSSKISRFARSMTPHPDSPARGWNTNLRLPRPFRGSAFALAASLVLGAGLLLAPGAARAANECGGAIGTTDTSRTCTSTTYADGIIYQNVNPGPTAVATVVVPGAAPAWTVTSGSGNTLTASGILLDSDEPATAGAAGGGLALTVGGTGSSNNVNIRQRASNANSGNDNNIGILINQQRRGASTTTLTVHSGVTIGQPSGTGTGRMNRHGIRARVWLGSGAATFTNHGTIHSALEGIDVQRGDSADTDAATTIVNSGDITAGFSVIKLRYFAGDTTGGGGNTAAVTTGDAKIDNSGTLTRHGGAAAQGAIELEYARGHGNAEVDNRGAITATASGLTNGFGIRLRYRNLAGTASGNATIRNSHPVASKQHALVLENAGTGGALVVNSGALTAENANQSGIWLRHTGTTATATAMTVTVTNSGAITSTGHAIDVAVSNKNTDGDNVGISIAHSAGAIRSSAGGGILAVVGEVGGGTPVNMGDAVIMVTGGRVRSDGTILEAKNLEAGDIAIAVSAGVTLISNNQHGIFAELHAENTAGGVTVEHAGTVTGPKTGIYVRRQAPTGAGEISVTNRGQVKKAGDANWIGILVDDKGMGAVAIANSGTVGEAALKHGQGIVATKTGAGGGVTITNSGTVFAEGRGIVAIVSSDEGATTGNTGIARIDVTGGSLAVGGVVLEAKNEQAGNVDIDVAAGVTLTSERDHGIFAELAANNAAGEVAIDNAAALTTGKTGIYVRRGEDCAGGWTCASTGAIRIDNSGEIVKTGETAWMGILVEERGTGPVTVTNSGAIGGAGADSRHDIGILVQGNHARDVAAGAFTVANSGDLTAKLYGIWVPVAAADRRIDIDHSGEVTGRKGIFAQIGRLSAEGETRRAADQPAIDIVWAGGDFSHGTAARDGDAPRFKANTAASAVFQDTEVEVERIARDREHGSAVGIEAQVMTWLHLAREVARGDDREIADAAAQAALLDVESTDPAVRAKAKAIVAQFRSALLNDDLIVPASVIAGANPQDDPQGGIDTDGDGEMSEAEIVAYLTLADPAYDRITLLRNVLKHGLSQEEKAVLAAVLEGHGAGLTAALDDPDANFSDAYKAAVRALLDNYNVGNIRVAVNGGAIVSRGDGIRAYYAIHHENNGAIEVTVAEGATVTGGVAGIWVANAGHEGTGEDGERIVRQSVTVHGTVTGGTDAGVHLDGGGRLTVGEMGRVFAGSSGRAILVNHPGRAAIRIDGLVRGAAPGAGVERHGAVHLTGGGSVTVGGTGRVEANGAPYAIRGDNMPTRVAVLQASRFAGADGKLTKVGVTDALARLGTVGGDGIGERGAADKVPVSVDETDLDGERTGYYLPVDLDTSTGAPTTEGNDAYAGLDDCPTAGQELRDGECVPSPSMPVVPPSLPFSCEGIERCRFYEALPSMLLAMNGLPGHAEGERVASASAATGLWARLDGVRGEWEAKRSTQANVAYDHNRYGVRVGANLAGGESLRFGASLRGLNGSAEMARGGGEVDVTGLGLGVNATALAGSGFYIDAQAAAIRYDVEVDVSSAARRHKVETRGQGYALAAEIGRPVALPGGVSVTPRAGFAWSQVSLDDFTDPASLSGRGARVSVEKAESLAGHMGVTLEADAGNGLALSGSVDMIQEFSEETEAKIAQDSLKASAAATGIRFGLGGTHSWGEGDRYAVSAQASYATGDSDNNSYGGRLTLRVSF